MDTASETIDQPPQRQRYRILYQVESWLEGPMFILALVWLWLFVDEFINGLSPFEEKLGVAIWILFIIEYVLKLILAPRKLKYIKNNWLTLIALVIPAFRAFRLVNAIRLLRASRVVTTTRFVRALTSTKRFLSDLNEASGPDPTPEMHVGVLVIHRPLADKEELVAFAEQLVQDVQPDISRATGTDWYFHVTEPSAQKNDDTHQPADFLDEASLRMAEGPYDLVVVVTDVALASRRNYTEPALPSLVSRVFVISPTLFDALHIRIGYGSPCRTGPRRATHLKSSWTNLLISYRSNFTIGNRADGAKSSEVFLFQQGLNGYSFPKIG